MNIELTKEIVLDLIKGSTPSMDIFNKLNKLGLGTYSDHYCTFYWNRYKLENMSIDELHELYLYIKSNS